MTSIFLPTYPVTSARMALGDISVWAKFFFPRLTMCQTWKCATSDILLSRLTNFVRHKNVPRLTFLPHI